MSDLNPLQIEEWRSLLAATRGSAVADLVARLAQAHGMTSTALAQPAAASLAPTFVADPARDEAIRARLPPGLAFSRYQLDLFQFIADGQGDGLVAAVAGSGKTSSLVLAAVLIAGDGLFLAFNRHIADELTARLEGTAMIAKTIHGIGYATLARHLRGRLNVQEDKYDRLIRDRTALLPPDVRRPLGQALRDLVSLTRLTLTNPLDTLAVDALIEHFGIEIEPAVREDALTLLPVLIERGEEIAYTQRLIDYTDQLYLPHRWNLKPRQLPWVLVDECQDLSAAQLDLVLKCRAPGGRILFVGDPHQAIMGFAGADADSFWAIQRQTGATLLPLSVCYRCPRSHIALAQEVMPSIEAAPNAPEGTIITIREGQLGDHVQRGDMIICRMTAPLITICIQFIQRRMSASVRGRDIGRQLDTIVRAVADQPGYRWELFSDLLDAYEALMVAKLARRKNSEGAIVSLRDRCLAVRACYEHLGAASLPDLLTQIGQLFNGENPDVVLSTIHRAKGLERLRIFLLYPDKVPLRWERQLDWEWAQEENLRYVALTRARETLYFVEREEAAHA